MKKIILLLLLLNVLFGCNKKKESYDMKGKVTKVADGDTFTIRSDGNNYRIRMYGIDAPESDQKHGKEASNYLSNIIMNKEVNIKIMDKDQYDRIVGKVFYNERDINKMMLESGNAWYYEFHAKNETEYRDAHENARNMKKGLWNNPKPENPRNYRNKKRKSN